MMQVLLSTGQHGILCFFSLLVVCSSQQPFPDIDKLLKQSYQTHVEYTQQSKNESQFITEFHDRAEGKGYIRRLAEGLLTHEYYFLSTNEYVKMTDTWCDVSKLSDQLNVYNFQDDGRQYAFASSVLKLLPANVMAYKGSKKVRGIITSHFQGTKDGVSFDAYFREGKWRGADNDTTHVPVRVVLNNSSDSELAFYDFSRFRRFIQKYSNTNLKTGVGCMGKKNPPSMILPRIPNQVSFEYEFFDSEVNSVKSPARQLELNTIWYDASQRIARVDLTSSWGKTTTEIHDFNNGVMYVKDDRTCSVKPITLSRFSYTKQGRMVNLMKTPDQMLGLGTDMYFVGKGDMRGVSCQIWEFVEKNVVLKGQNYQRVVTTFYFTELHWHSTLHETDDLFIPLRKTVMAYENEDDMRQPDRSVEYNIFDYTEQDRYDPDFFKNFDITDCFAGPGARTYFDIYLKGDKNVSRSTLLEYSSKIRTVTKEQIYTLAEISPLRLPGIYMTTMEDDSIHIVVVLLAQPPALASFVLDENDDFPGRNMRKVKLVASQEECAQQCLPDTNCMVFLYRDHVCYFADTDDFKSWGTQISNKVHQKFTKADANITALYQSNDNVVKKIRSEVESNNFVVSFRAQVSDELNSVTLRAFKFLADVSPFGERTLDKPYDLAVTGNTFSLAENTAIVAKPLGITGPITSAQQCYRMCTKENSLSCASFSYCPATNECRLSSVIVQSSDDKESQNVLAKDSRCNIYTRSYLNFFEKFPGTLVRVGGDESFTGITSPTECAKECMHNQRIRCRGFEFCGNSKYCILHEAHFLDIDPLDIANRSDECSHYAAKFIADYWEVGTQIVNDPKARVVELVSIEDCAKQCSLDPSGLCQSFNYCPGNDGPDARCYLNTVTALDDGVKLEKSEDCHHYYQQDDVHDFITRGRSKAPQKRFVGMTSGSLGGLLFAMLLVGIIIAVGGLFVYNYWQTKRGPNDGGAVRFVSEPPNE